MDQESIRRRGGDFSLSSSSEPEFGGATTSGGEEVVRILAEARRKYGRIRSFREKERTLNLSNLFFKLSRGYNFPQIILPSIKFYKLN